jgi:hypothetical protein
MRALPILLIAFMLFLLLGVAWYSQRFEALMPGPG